MERGVKHPFGAGLRAVRPGIVPHLEAPCFWVSKFGYTYGESHVWMLAALEDWQWNSARLKMKALMAISVKDISSLLLVLALMKKNLQVKVTETEIKYV